MRNFFQKLFKPEKNNVPKKTAKIVKKKVQPFSMTFQEFGTNQELCEYLRSMSPSPFSLHFKGEKRIKTDAVFNSMLKVDRKNYCKPDTKPYFDGAQPLGHQATISAPHMHALMLELVNENFERVKAEGCKKISFLDVGSGSGYICACVGRLLQHGNHFSLTQSVIVGVDHIGELVEFSLDNLSKAEPAPITSMVRIFEGDGFEGCVECAPFDVIHIGAAIPMDRIDTLFGQLKPGGEIIAPTGPKEGSQRLCVIRRVVEGEEGDDSSDGGEPKREVRVIESVRFVPLAAKEWQLNEANVEKKLKVRNIGGKMYNLNVFSSDLSKIKRREDIVWDTAETVIARLEKEKKEKKK